MDNTYAMLTLLNIIRNNCNIFINNNQQYIDYVLTTFSIQIL